MDIREIHIDQFGVWEDVSIRSLTPSLNVIHLADGGRPIDFSRFLHETLFGFSSKSHQDLSGSLLLADGRHQWRVDRSLHGNGERSFNVTMPDRPGVAPTAFGNRLSKSNSIFAGYVSIPKEEVSTEENWQWLSRHPDIAARLLESRSRVCDSGLLSASNLSLSSHGNLLEQLGSQREQLLADIGGLKIRLADAPPKTPVAPASEIAVAELKDELRTLQRQLIPMQVAIEFADRWQELMRLRKNVPAKKLPGHLKELLADYRILEAEKADWQEILSRRPQRKSAKKSNSDEHEVRKLLEQRDWITAAVDRSPSEEVSLDSTAGEDEELRHAGYLLDNAKQESETAQRRLHEFSKRTGFDWSNLLVEEHATPLVEISNDSPIAQAPPATQLAELKRRRLWIREEHRYLLGQQEISIQTYVWIAILLTLSVASLFGTLLVVSPGTQWVLAAFGLAGIVASGALKLSIELRASRQLNRTKDRLQQIDSEILTLTELVLNEQQDAATARRRAEQKLHALQLQQDSQEANHRHHSAEVAFRELLDVHGLPLTLSPEEATRSLRRKASVNVQEPVKSSADRKISRWTKRARDLIQRIDGVRPGDDPLELLTFLELISEQLRVAARSSSNVDNTRSERDSARRELNRIEKRQRSLLRRGDVDDVFALEAAIEAADQQAENRRRIRALERELSVVIDSHEDRDEIRELLEMFGVDELRVRLSERLSIHAETEAALNAQQVEQPIVEKQRDISPAQQELDRNRLRLSVIETQIRRAMKQAQAAAVLRNIARTLAGAPEEEPFLFLSELTNGRWSSVELRGDNFVLKGPRGVELPLAESSDTELAWLALQLNAASKRAATEESLPLVLLADSLFATSVAANIFDVLQQAEDHGVQVLLLTGNRLLVNQLAEAGLPVVRVGLRESPPALRIAQDADLSQRHDHEVRPRLAQF